MEAGSTGGRTHQVSIIEHGQRKMFLVCQFEKSRNTDTTLEVFSKQENIALSFLLTELYKYFSKLYHLCRLLMDKNTLFSLYISLNIYAGFTHLQLNNA